MKYAIIDVTEQNGTNVGAVAEVLDTLEEAILEGRKYAKISRFKHQPVLPVIWRVADRVLPGMLITWRDQDWAIEATTDEIEIIREAFLGRRIQSPWRIR